MTIDELINATKNRLANSRAQSAVAEQNIAALHARQSAGEVVSPGELKLNQDSKIRSDVHVSELEARLRELGAEKAKDERDTKLQSTSTPTAAAETFRASQVGRAYDQVGRVTLEPRTYQDPSRQRGAFGEQPSFLADLFASQIKRDPAASERLARHGREVEVEQPDWHARAVNTGAVSGFTPPAYLEGLFAEYARAGRPVADAVSKHPLPATGMVVNLPRITTPSIVAAQSAEAGAVASQDMDDTLLALNVRTIAGYVDVTRQALERTSMVEQVIMTDLAKAYATEVDRQVLAADGTSGTHLGILSTSGVNTVTYTDASPTLVELWAKLASACGQIMSQRFAGPTHIIMGPAEWAWVLSSMDSQGRPIIGATGPMNAIGDSGATPFNYTANGGGLFGCKIVVDGNMPVNLGAGTNETRIIVADLADSFLFEDNGGAPTQLRFDESLSSTLGVRLLAYGYSAFTAGRQPKAVSVIAGTGLITPAL